jgi:UDP-N-acetylglucosamine 2-epimerase
MKVLTVVGARPQFIKAAPVSTALAAAGIEEFLVHTGQHYDERMSDLFFSELGLRAPDVNLCIGSGPHGQQTGRMLEAIERILTVEKPDWVIVYGDTNSTLAGALAAAKLHLPLAHIEAGLRSYNRGMPEEINRVMTDHLSQRLFCPSVDAVANLAREGIVAGASAVGDVMYDALLHFADQARRTSTILNVLGISPRRYHVATIHRAELTDNPERLRALLSVLDQLDVPVVLPLHPRTRATLDADGQPLQLTGGLRLIEPLGYLDMLRLIDSCQRVLTDSGGLQKEAFWLRRPCVTLREETEWLETVRSGWNTIAGTNEALIRSALSTEPPSAHPDLYGDGHAAARIATALASGS